MKMLKKFVEKEKAEWKRFQRNEDGFITILSIIFAAVFFVGGSIFLWRLQEALYSLIVCVFIIAVPLVFLLLLYKWSPTARKGMRQVAYAAGPPVVHGVQYAGGQIDRRIPR